MLFGKNNDEWLGYSGKKRTGYIVNVENIRRSTMKITSVSGIYPDTLNLEQCSRDRVIVDNDMILVGMSEGYILCSSSDNVEVEDLIKRVNTFEYIERKKSSEMLGRALRGPFKDYWGEKQSISTKSIRRSCGLGYKDWDLNLTTDIPLKSINIDLDGIKIPAPKDWIRDESDNKHIAVIKFGKYGRLLIYQSYNRDELFGTINSVMLSRAERINTPTVEYQN